MSEDILFTREKHIGLITLQRTQALNALTLPMILALQQQLQAWEDDKDIHAVIVQAAQGKAFCAGGDVRWLYEAGKRHDPKQMQFFWHEYRLNHFIHQFKKPYIALMNGITMGGGVGISLHGSHPLATEHFVFAMPETSIGFFPDIGASRLLARCPGQFGVYLGLTGNRLGPIDALELGLVKYHASAAKLEDILASLIQADLKEEAHARVDECLKQFNSYSENNTLSTLQGMVNAAFQHSSIEAVFEHLSKSEDAWHQETLLNLQQKAPLSLKITLAQIEKARSMTLAECLKMDYCLVNHFMHDHDFYEGVRALLVDKDKSPRWQPASLAEVTKARVADYFECGQPELPFFT